MLYQLEWSVYKMFLPESNLRVQFLLIRGTWVITNTKQVTLLRAAYLCSHSQLHTLPFLFIRSVEAHASLRSHSLADFITLMKEILLLEGRAAELSYWPTVRIVIVILGAYFWIFSIQTILFSTLIYVWIELLLQNRKFLCIARKKMDGRNAQSLCEDNIWKREAYLNTPIVYRATLLTFTWA